ncbi:MAG TPA: DUF1350 family protein [Geminocystis sp. M7585_C2015_104]|nr:DUF1350 family protein [Geminocystis sp. M7585_C2015_104]
MQWQELCGSWVLIPPYPVGVIHFLGGAFVATAPQITYRWLLEKLASDGFIIVATPFLNTLNHKAIALSVQNRFEHVLFRLEYQERIDLTGLPIYGIGHSMGCKLHLLIGSLLEVERAGNILISFNNFPFKKAIPFAENIIDNLQDNIKQLSPLIYSLQNLRNPLPIPDFLPLPSFPQEPDLEFIPSPTQTQEIIKNNYKVRRNLLIKFKNDTIDQTEDLQKILEQKHPEMISTLKLPGNHLTPLGPDLNKGVTDEFLNQVGVVGQWVKENVARDFDTLYREINRWLNPCVSYSP